LGRSKHCPHRKARCPTAEAEEAYNSNPVYLDYAIEGGEQRHREIGETLAGRILVVVSMMRGDLIRIVTT
jgi:uncharacterized DUF497 family protein